MRKTFIPPLVGIVVLTSVIAAESELTNATRIVISGPEIVSKGFPCIIKMTVSGPIREPSTSLTDETALLRVFLKSKDTDKQYVIASWRGSDITYTTREGERIDGVAEKRWETAVDNGKHRSDLFDLASIHPEFGRGTVLDDVPAGQYEVTVEFPRAEKKSNSITMRLVSPTATEQDYLQQVRSLGSFSRGKTLLWNRVLGSGVPLPGEKWNALSSTTKEQTAFHMLLLRLTSETTLGAADGDAIKTTPLPKFLEPEKECLLYEVENATGKSDETRFNELTLKYPDLQWRLQEIKTNGKTFLLSRKPVPNGGK